MTRGGKPSSMPGASRVVEVRDHSPDSNPTSPISQPISQASYAPLLIQKGTRIGDHYRVIEAIGIGAVGQVLLARDEMLQRNVAVKVLRPATQITEKARRRFLNEGRAMARVRHENVVAVHAVGDIAGAPYKVMEYGEGCDLEAWLETRPLPPIDESLEILRQICRGVQAIHNARTVHRDLKPSNVMLGEGFRIAVGDLGLARFADVRETTGSLFGMVGTPTHMSPEAIMGSVEPQLASRADIYSLGVIGFQLLTGYLPFVGDNVAKLMTQHITKRPPVPSAVRLTLPPAFDAPILAALAKEPKQRPTSPSKWYEALLTARRHTSSHSIRNILVADGDEDFRHFALEVMSDAVDDGHVKCVSDGVQALEAIEMEVFSLLLLELEIPRMNGVEVMAGIRELPTKVRPAVVVMSAIGSGADWALLSTLGADSFLVKPIASDQLSRTALRLLGARRSP